MLHLRLTVAREGRQAGPMPPETPTAKKIPWVKLGVVAIVVTVGAVLVWRGANLRALVDQGMALIRSGGPWVFFSAMVVLPAVGAPMLAFSIPAGEAFAPQMTMGGVVAAVLVAIALNLALTYWLAHRALRPLVARIIKRYGYTVPRVTPENALSVTLLVRLTPGPPFFLQSYVLAFADVPFRLYMLVSWLCVLPWTVGAVVLGQGMMNGNFKAAGIGFGVIVATVAAVQLIRRRYMKRES